MQRIAFGKRIIGCDECYPLIRLYPLPPCTMGTSWNTHHAACPTFHATLEFGIIHVEGVVHERQDCD
jgi:hypothetical protein